MITLYTFTFSQLKRETFYYKVYPSNKEGYCNFRSITFFPKEDTFSPKKIMATKRLTNKSEEKSNTSPGAFLLPADARMADHDKNIK